MVSSLIRGRYLLVKALGPDGVDIRSDAALLQRDGRIVEIGSYEALHARHPETPVVGSGRELILPGLVNAHHHSGVSAALTGCADGPLELWLSELYGQRDVDPYLDTLFGCLSLMRSGVTTVMHNLARWIPPAGGALVEDSERVLRAYADAGMRVAFSVAMKEQNRIVYGPDDAFLASLPGSLADALRSRLATALSGDGYVALFEELAARHAADGTGRVRILLSPKNLQWVSDTLLLRVKELAGRHRTGIHMHLGETRYQHRHALATHGRTPLGHLHELGFLGPELSCAHGVWLTDEDLDVAAATGVTICHNASSNLRLRSGIAPLGRMLEHGVSVAIGMDSTALNDDDDMLQEIRVVSNLHRAPGHDGWSPTPGELLHMATRAGSAACGFQDVGTLEVGQRADLILLDVDRMLDPYGSADRLLPDALIERARPEHVETVVIDGVVVLADGRATRLDQAAVLAELREQLVRPLAPHELERRRLVEALRPYIRRFYQAWP